MGDTSPYRTRHGKRATTKSPTFDDANAVGRITPPLDRPVTAQEIYRILDFDPDGSSQFTTAIRSSSRVYQAIIARRLFFDAVEQTRRQFPDSVTAHNDKADAFRHMWWSYEMTKRFGPDVAKLFGDAHERSAPNEDGERLMDLYNNATARSLALDPLNNEFGTSEVIRDALERGRGKIRPFNVLGAQSNLRRQRRSRVSTY